MPVENEAAPLIRLNKVTRTIGDGVVTTLVRDIDLDIRGGEFAAIVGPSGSGKSSLLYLLGLLDAPTSGEVLVQGKNASHLGDAARAHLRLSLLGFVFQFHFLLPEFTALANVMLPMRALGRLDERAMHERAEHLLASLGLAEHAA
ncbi:MAG: ATP-binding cassette domain-containing protein, partial [Rhizobiales bacterium]|nr:ATP-binding cassette domain-containing protein [Hyphomicrobiales bacterium]